MYDSLTGMFTAMLLVAAAVGAALAYLIPWLWSIVKPLIHAATG